MNVRRKVGFFSNGHGALPWTWSRVPLDEFTVIPIQVFNWVSRPQPAFHEIAAAGSIVLLVALLTLNAAAIVLRNRYSRRS